MTAMMALFLVLWLTKTINEEQRHLLAHYFSPNNVLGEASSGNGAPFGGQTLHAVKGMISDSGVVAAVAGPSLGPTPKDEDAPEESATATAPPPPVRVETRAEAPSPSPSNATAVKSLAAAEGLTAAAIPTAGDSASTAAATPAAEAREAEQRAFVRAAAQIRERVLADPQLAGLAGQLRIDETPEGLRLQLLDAEHEAMFATGSAMLNDHARALLQRIAAVLAGLPNAFSIAGHTDAAPYRGSGMSNWELSTERANATRRFLVENGLPDARFRSVTGNADRDLLVPAVPLAPANRRIAIIVLHQTKAPAEGGATTPAAAVPRPIASLAKL
jgi:chemotaxis protein MotB